MQSPTPRPSSSAPATPTAPTSGLTAPRLLAAALVLALAFLALAGARPLNVPDEGRYADVAREMVVTGDLVTPRLDHVPFLDKPPLLYWIDAVGVKLLGATPLGARFAVALLGALGCLAVLVAGARLGGWRAGLLGAVVLAASPLWYGGAQYVNHDLTVAMWITAATLSLALAFPPGGRVALGWLLGGAVAATLAVLTKGLIGLVFPFGITGLWLVATRRPWKVGWLFLAFFLAIGLAAPWFLACQRANPDFFHYFFVVQHLERFTGRGFNNPMGPGFYLVVVPLGLLPWTAVLPAAVVRAFRAWRADAADARGDLLLLLWPALVIGFFTIPESKIVGYALPAVPPLAMLVGRWWDAALAEPARPRPWLAGATAALVAALGLACLGTPTVAPALEPTLAPFPAGAARALWLAGALLLAAAVVVARALATGAVRRALAALVLAVAVLLTGLVVAVPALVPPGTDALAARLRPLLRDGDQVVAWRRWFYDLHFLIDRREPTLMAEPWDDPAIAREDNWRHELWTGRSWRPESAAWLISPDEAVARCAGAARCFFVARTRDVAGLRERLELWPLATQGDATLLATRAAAPPDALPR